MLCLVVDCNKRALYNYRGCNGVFCHTHKINNMVKVILKSCIFGCNLNAKWYDLGLKIFLCDFHKTINCVDAVKYKRCHEPGCSRESTYSFDINDNVKYCINHRKDGMKRIFISSSYRLKKISKKKNVKTSNDKLKG